MWEAAGGATEVAMPESGFVINARAPILEDAVIARRVPVEEEATR